MLRLLIKFMLSWFVSASPYSFSRYRPINLFHAVFLVPPANRFEFPSEEEEDCADVEVTKRITGTISFERGSLGKPVRKPLRI